MTMHKEGYRWAEPGKVTSATCKVCGADCHIDRNVMGPTNHASAVGGLKQLHDHIRCPHAGSNWHNQAVDLKREAETTPSPTLAAILRRDLETLLQRIRSMTTARLASTRDPRLTDLVRLGRGDGFSTYLGRFDGKPAFIVDCGTLNDFLDEADATEDSVSVQVFATDAERDAHVEHLRRTSPAALGVAVAEE